jgi:DNA-binding HxlR family transcriptional regulator
MSRRRSYNQYCGLAKSLDVVGERWTLLIVRNLLLGPLRYSDLLRGLPGITTNLLAKRLREMEEFGLIERVRGASADGGHAYRLTALGAGLEPVVHALGGWAWMWMESPGKHERRSIEWLLVALRRRYRGGAMLRVELVADDVPYRMMLSKRRAEIMRGEVPSPDLTIRGTGATMSDLFLKRKPGGGVPPGIVVNGSSESLRTLLSAFATEEIDPVVASSR